MKKIACLLLALILAAGLGSCISYGGNLRIFVLSALAMPEGKCDSLLVVKSVKMPSHLRRLEFVTRTEHGELIFSDSLQWGQTPDEGILMVMNEEFAQMAETDNMERPVEVRLDISHFEQEAGNGLRLAGEYVWRIGVTVYSGRFDFRRNVDGNPSSLVNGYNDMLGQLALEIADSLKWTEKK